MKKKYCYQAARSEWEKPTEPKYIFNTTAKVTVLADSEEEALALAKAKLRDEYYGTGVMLLGEPELIGVYDLPVDWSYGYDDDRRSGPTESIGDLVGQYYIGHDAATTRIVL